MKKLILILFLGVLFFSGAESAKAAKLYFRMEKDSYKTAETGFATLNVDTEGKTANAFEATVLFDPSLVEITKTSNDKIIINMWVQSASIDNTAGRLSLKGVALNPGFKGNPGRLIGFYFKTKGGGKCTFNVADATVLAHDGKGTRLSTSIVPREISISGPVATRSGLRISSSSHPDQNKWYNKPTVYLSWKTQEKDVKGYAYAFDKKPATDPTAITNATSALQTKVTSGLWYAHIRLKQTAGWLKTEHFAVRVDSTAPEASTITVLPRQNESFLPVIRVKSKDSHSGIAYYEVYANGKFLTKAATIDSYRLKDLQQGKNTIEVKATDNAGNTRSDKISVLYNSIPTKTTPTPATPQPSTTPKSTTPPKSTTTPKSTTPTQPVTPVKPKVNTPILFD